MKELKLSSQGAWVSGPDGAFVFKVESSAPFILQVSDRIAIAKRIVACVNACEGVPTDVLENTVQRGGALMYQQERRKIAEAQRDELLAALERLLPWAECMEYAPPGMEFSGDHPIAVARAAIARVKGGAS